MHYITDQLIITKNMIYFDTDYMAGAHPEVMDKLVETNLCKTTGYGTDHFTMEAEQRILQECGLTEGKVYFLEGGTQTNMLVITRLLDYCDGVIAADSGHINIHEAGAIEAAGHKVIALPSINGKLTAEAIDTYVTEYYRDDTYPHIVRPGMVYLTFPTEVGTLYSREELTAISCVCRHWHIPLYMDGARLAYGLGAEENDVTLKDIATLCDAFYIGGTKCGALFGEAVVTGNTALFSNFFSLCKQRGAVLSKGRLLGVQFLALFHDGLYYRIGRHADRMAQKLKQSFVQNGFTCYMDSPTNQQFFTLPNEVIEKLRKSVSFELWGPMGENTSVVRFVTDWSTKEEDIDFLHQELEKEKLR